MKEPYQKPNIETVDASDRVRWMFIEWDGKLLNTQFIKFEIHYQDPNKKTMDIHVYNKKDLRLGSIHWHGPWRKYVFEPRDNFQMIFDDNCLTDISDFIKMLMILHKL